MRLNLQNKHETRLLFLKEFCKELIINSKPPEIPEHEKLIEQELGESYEIGVPIKIEVPVGGKKEERAKQVLPLPKPPVSRYRLKPVTIKPQLQIHPQVMPEIKEDTSARFQPQVQPQPSPGIIKLEKLNFLVQDPRVTVIECPGPGKFILARTSGQITTTRISLTQEEIQSIINVFSEQAKIPIVSGLFKAAVGNLIITAVISDLVGSRFIITKMTPRYMMEQQSQRLPVR